MNQPDIILNCDFSFINCDYDFKNNKGFIHTVAEIMILTTRMRCIDMCHVC
jgi:hypothetical protein